MTAGVPFGSPIESRASVPYQSEAVVVIRTWRQVERDLAAVKHDLADVGSETREARRLDAETVRLIDEWAPAASGVHVADRRGAPSSPA
jgi:hypothetical protein